MARNKVMAVLSTATVTCTPANSFRFVTLTSPCAYRIQTNHLDFYVFCFLRQDREHGLGTIQYANGDNYFGLIHNRKRSGHGLLEYANKDVYEGEKIILLCKLLCGEFVR